MTNFVGDFEHFNGKSKVGSKKCNEDKKVGDEIEILSSTSQYQQFRLYVSVQSLSFTKYYKCFIKSVKCTNCNKSIYLDNLKNIYFAFLLGHMIIA